MNQPWVDGFTLPVHVNCCIRPSQFPLDRLLFDPSYNWMQAFAPFDDQPRGPRLDRAHAGRRARGRRPGSGRRRTSRGAAPRGRAPRPRAASAPRGSAPG